MALVREMREEQVLPDTISYNAVMNACARSAQWERAVGVLQDRWKQGKRVDQKTFNAAMNACEKARQWVMALHLLDAMSAAKALPGTISYSTTVSAVGRSGDWEKALWLFADIPRQQLPLDAIAFAAAITACDRGLQWQRALELLSGMDGLTVEADVVCFNAALSSLEKCSAWEVAVDLLGAMERRLILADDASYGAVASACGKAGNAEKAVSVLKIMRERVVSPGAATYGAVCSALGAAAKWRDLWNVNEEMSRSRLEADAAVLDDLLGAAQGLGLPGAAPSIRRQLADRTSSCARRCKEVPLERLDDRLRKQATLAAFGLELLLDCGGAPSSSLWAVERSFFGPILQNLAKLPGQAPSSARAVDCLPTLGAQATLRALGSNGRRLWASLAKQSTRAPALSAAADVVPGEQEALSSSEGPEVDRVEAKLVCAWLAMALTTAAGRPVRRRQRLMGYGIYSDADRGALLHPVNAEHDRSQHAERHGLLLLLEELLPGLTANRMQAREDASKSSEDAGRSQRAPSSALVMFSAIVLLLMGGLGWLLRR
eukprot:TRINITY_DN25686_c0_g1_i3.p1 TRINITY_DN25686_c0_g1~~TRINITY_DN25686_c0_g1_i3.p1  ORF type:complete len:546 (-),score=133.94 TRINITY_DN25686_c0_g1_i3:47-1684(-)